MDILVPRNNNTVNKLRNARAFFSRTYAYKRIRKLVSALLFEQAYLENAKVYDHVFRTLHVNIFLFALI